ncbi:MAG: hypothetical protein VYA60_05200 [Pseudomonadota bacterium]|nr:hypothetical protein [Pseudomonadota bacterium]
MNALTIATSNLTNAISRVMPLDGYLILEVGVSEDGMKTISASVLSGVSMKKNTCCSLTGEITNGYHKLINSYKLDNREVLAAFRELMFAFNTALDNEELKKVCYQNSLGVFNAVIKPWSVEITHIEEHNLIRAARMKDYSSMLISGVDGTDHGSFKVGEPRTAIQGAYELLSSALLLAGEAQQITADNAKIGAIAA